MENNIYKKNIYNGETLMVYLIIPSSKNGNSFKL